MTTQKYAPGEVTPEQMEQYRQTYDAAKRKRDIADARYYAAYYAYSDALYESKAAESVYVWAQHGMVRSVEEIVAGEAEATS